LGYRSLSEAEAQGFRVSMFQIYRVTGLQGYSVTVSNSKLYTKFAEEFSPTGRCPKDKGVFSMFQSYNSSRVTMLQCYNVSEFPEFQSFNVS